MTNPYSQAYSEALEFFQVINKDRFMPTFSTIHLKCEPPQRGLYKLNIDSSCLGNPGKGGIASVIRDHSDN